MFDNKYSDLEKRIKKSQKKDDELFEIIDFYTRITESFKDFKEKIKIIEIKPKLRNLKEDNYSFDYINYIITVSYKEYLVFLKNDKPKNISNEDLELFFKIFSQNRAKNGLIIIWNDSELNSIKLIEEDLHAKPEGVIKYIRKERIPLEELINTELISSKKISEIQETPIKKIKEKKKLDLIHEFEIDLMEVYSEFANKKFKALKKEIFDSISKRDLELVKNLFSDFFLNEIDTDILRKKFRNLAEK